MQHDDYDRTSPESIENYSKGMIGKTFREISAMDDIRNSGREMNFNSQTIRDEAPPTYSFVPAKSEKDKINKGKLGQLIEEKYFHYKCNNDDHADFREAGVELKVTPFKRNKNGTVSAKERLIITMVDYQHVVEEQFYQSHVWEKIKLILLVYYLYDENIKSKLDYEIEYTQLFTPPKEDLKVIIEDFKKIVKKVRDGKAHELSESDTDYLAACTKSSSSKDRRSQPFSDEPAKPRAFSFKSSYMTYVLRTYVVPGKKTYESIGTGKDDETFEQHVVNKINQYRGWSQQDLASRFDVDLKKNAKNTGAILAYRILGIKGNKAEEFVKAGIVVKTIRIKNDGKIKEHMSFPAFKFKELAKETWDDSTFGNYLRETRFLFVVYQFDENDDLILKGCQFWNMPYSDLENEVRPVWEKTVQLLNGGLIVKKVGKKYHNNFPKPSENPVCHVRPHARDAKDTDELPDGRQYPKQCFWLKNDYILSQINDDIKK